MISFRHLVESLLNTLKGKAPAGAPNPYTQSTKGLSSSDRAAAIRAEFLRRKGKSKKVSESEDEKKYVVYYDDRISFYRGFGRRKSEAFSDRETADLFAASHVPTINE